MKRLHWVILFTLLLYGCGGQYKSYGELTDLEVLRSLSTMQAGQPVPGEVGQELHLTQTLDGVTVVIDWVHADQGSLFIGYHYEGIKGRRYLPAGEQLSEVGGEALKQTTAVGVTGRSDVLQVDLPVEYGAGYLSYPLPDEQAEGGAAQVQFSLSLNEVPVEAESMDWIGWLQGLVGKAPETGRAAAELAPADQDQIIGPFEFDLSIPIE